MTDNRSIEPPGYFELPLTSIEDDEPEPVDVCLCGHDRLFHGSDVDDNSWCNGCRCEGWAAADSYEPPRGLYRQFIEEGRLLG